MVRRFVFMAVLALGFGGVAGAEPLDNPAFGFSVDFPCQSATASQIVSTPTGGVSMTMFVCQNAGGSYFVAVSDTPKAAVTDANREGVLNGTIAAISANLKGTIRAVVPLIGEKSRGRDVLIDIPEQKAAARAHVFLANDRVYQAMAFVPAGKETGKEAIAFLDSFKLKPVLSP